VPVAEARTVSGDGDELAEWAGIDPLAFQLVNYAIK
jgi:hypothetical protein